MTPVTQAAGLYEACEHLFAQYPLAVDPVERDCNEVVFAAGQEFFILLSYRDGAATLRRWNSPARVHLAPDGTAGECGLAHAEAQRAVSSAVPVPRDGSLFAWVNNSGNISAVVAFRAGEPEDARPGFSVMPRVGTRARAWPPFAGESVFSPEIWDHIRSGRLVTLAPHLAGTTRAAWWADTRERFGCGSIAVPRDQRLAGGVILPQGLYVYYKLLLDSVAMPSLEDVLASPGKTDLGPCFREGD